jgi:predicted DNA binding CopG/RHH family protein
MKKPSDENIPNFVSPDEEMAFWDSHSAVEFIDETREVTVDASKAREARNKRRAQQISLRISRQILERTKNRAEALGVPYQTLIQLWIAERLEQEEARVKTFSSTTGRPSQRTAHKNKPSTA